jgi:ABC-type protease/lipase transport system fused ATPase/permease subunit
MDTATERVFVGHLEKALKPEQTLIVATHRNAILALVNRVVVIENGSVAVDGPRDAVLKRLSENQLRPQPAVTPGELRSGVLRFRNFWSRRNDGRR